MILRTGQVTERSEQVTERSEVACGDDIEDWSIIKTCHVENYSTANSNTDHVLFRSLLRFMIILLSILLIFQ